jgi:hypothetical protein
MRIGITVDVNAADRARREAIVADRNSLYNTVASADRAADLRRGRHQREIMR